MNNKNRFYIFKLIILLATATFIASLGFLAHKFFFTQSIKTEQSKPENKEDTSIKPNVAIEKSDKEPIQLGAILGLSGSFQELDVNVFDGLNLRFKQCNKNNEIRGKEIKLVYKDHEYQQIKALDYFKKFYSDDKIDIFIRLMGSSITNLCLPFANEHNILILFPCASAKAIKGQKNVILLKNTYENEAIELVRYASKKLNAAKIVLFYQDDDYGQGPAEEAEKELKKLGHAKNSYLLVPHEQNTASLPPETIEMIKKFAPNCVIFFSVPVVVTNLINNLHLHTTKHLMGTSALDGISFNDFLKSKEVKFIRTHGLPSLNETNLQIVKEYLDEIKSTSLIPNTYSFEGYVGASIFIEACKKINAKVTKEKIIAVIKSFKNYKFKGLTLTFNPETCSLLQDISLEKADGKWIKLPDDSNASKTEPIQSSPKSAS